MSTDRRASLLSPESILETSTTITLQIQQGWELEAILQHAIAAARNRLQTDRVIIYRFLPNQGAIVAFESVGMAWPPLLGQHIDDPCFHTPWVERYQQAQSTTISEIGYGMIDPCHTQHLEGSQAQAQLVVPLLLHGSPWGLLMVHHCRSPREWQPLDLQYLQQMALQLGLALQIADLRQSQKSLTAALEQRTSSEWPTASAAPVTTAYQPTATDLQAHEPYYAQMLDAVQDLVFCTAPDETLTYANQATCDYYGLTRAQLRRVTGVVLSPPESAQQSRQDDQHVFATGESVERLEVFQRRSDGERRYCHTIKAPLLDADGKVSQIVGVARDITEHKRTEIALAQALKELNHHIEHSPLATIRWNRDFQVESWSKQAEALFGWQAAAVLGKTMYEWRFIVEADQEQVQQAAAQLLAGKSVICQNRNYRADGSMIDCEWFNSVLVDTTGQLVSILSFAQDVSERKAAAAALQSSESRYRSVITAMAEGIAVQQPDGTITAFNASAERILGLTPEQMTGKAALDDDWRTLHEDGSPFPRETHPAMIALSTGRPQAKVIMGICKGDGSTTWLAINAQPLFHEAEVTPYAVVTSFADITELKQAELALKWESEQRRLMLTITQQMRQTLDLNHILQTTATAVRQFLQTDRVLIYQFAPNWSGTVIAEAVAAGWPSILGVQITDSYFVETQGQAHAQGEIVATADIYTAHYSPCHIEWLEQLQVRAKLVVPILQGEHLWGLLVTQHCQTPRPWAALEIALLQQLATQLAIAIQQAALFQQVQTLNINLEEQVQARTAQLQQALAFEALLKQMTDRVRDSLDESHILQTAVAVLAQGLPLSACDTGLYNAAQTTSTIAYEVTNTLASAQGVTFALATATHPDVYPYLLSGQSCQFSDVTPHPLRADQRRQTTLAVPIVDDQGVLGDLWLFKPPPSVFDEPEVRLVQQVANQCAIALRQARLYRAAQSQVQELERLNQLKDDFLSTVSHELRTPMANIKMATQMLEISLHRLGVLDDDASVLQRYVSILREEGQRELTLINNLLDLTRLDADTEPLTLTTIDLQYYLPHLAESFSQRTQQQQQQLVLHIPDQLPPFTTALPYLERILTELLHNACKYTPAGETITVRAQALAGGMELCVSNTGVEIPAAEGERIFDKFYRIPNNDPWKHGGTGLGLALVKQLTERLGGQIHFASGSGQTTFVLTFRQCSSATERTPSLSAP